MTSLLSILSVCGVVEGVAVWKIGPRNCAASEKSVPIPDGLGSGGASRDGEALKAGTRTKIDLWPPVATSSAVFQNRTLRVRPWCMGMLGVYYEPR